MRKRRVSYLVVSIMTMFMFGSLVEAQSISVSCPNEVVAGSSFDCQITADYNQEYGGVDADVSFDKELVLESFSLGSKFNYGELNQSRLSVYSNDDMTGGQVVGKFKVKVSIEGVGEKKIYFNNIKIVNKDFNNVSCSSVEVRIKIKEKVEDKVINSNDTSNSSNNSINSKKNNSNSNSNSSSSKDQEVSTNIKKIKFKEEDLKFDQEKNEYEVDVNNDVTNIQLDIELEDNRSKVEITGNDNLQVGENIVTIVVTGIDGSVNTYKILVNRLDKSNNNYLKKLKIKGYEIDFDKNKLEYYIDINSKTNKLEIVAIPEDEHSKVVMGGNNNLENGSIISIIVEAEDSSTRMYILKIISSNKQDYIFRIVGSIIMVIISSILIIVSIKKKGKRR